MIRKGDLRKQIIASVLTIGIGVTVILSNPLITQAAETGSRQSHKE